MELELNEKPQAEGDERDQQVPCKCSYDAMWCDVDKHYESAARSVDQAIEDN